MAIEERLQQIEKRLDRIERLAFLSYTQLREVAEYAYLNVRLEVDPEAIKRIPHTQRLSDRDVIQQGMSIQDLFALKWRMTHMIHAETKHDILALAKELSQAAERNTNSEEVLQAA